MTNLKSLQGLKILVTRPAHQAKNLCDEINALGGLPLLFPTLEIVPIEDNSALIDAIAQLKKCDVVIFISANAVQQVMPYWPASPLTRLSIAAMGQATARTLAQFKLHTNILPLDTCDSEGLLRHPKLLRSKDKKVTIFSGAGGRTLLANTLRRRGAVVTQVAVYRRVLPSHSTRARLQKEFGGGADIVISTSNESLQNLLDLTAVTARHWLQDLPLVVISARMASFAAELGFSKPLVAAGPSDAAILDALKAWYISKLTKRNL